MAAKASQCLQFSVSISSERTIRKKDYSLRFSWRCREERFPILVSSSLKPRRDHHRSVAPKLSCFPQNHEGMIGLPAIFGAPGTGASKPKGEDSPPRKKQNVGPSKANSARVFNVFEGFGDANISEVEFKRWMARTDEDKQTAATRGSLELFLFNTERERNTDENMKRVRELEAEVANLKKENKANTLKINKLEDEKKKTALTITTQKSDWESQEKLIKEKDSSIASFEEEVTSLTLEIDELKLEKSSGWQAEKEKITIQSIADGIKSCCRTFLAGEPNYDWRAIFGAGMANLMSDFSKSEAEAIALKRDELEKGMTAEPKETVLDEDSGMSLFP